MKHASINQFYSLSAKIYLHNKTLGRARRFSYKLGYLQHMEINFGNWQHRIVIGKAGFVRGRDFYHVTTLKTYSKNDDIRPEQND